MNEFLEEAKNTVAKAAVKVADTSGKLYEKTKITVAISSANSKIEKEYAAIGKIVYDSYKNSTEPDGDISAHCAAIDEKFAEIEAYREKLGQIKNKIICPMCGAEISEDSTYCAKCGEKL